MDAITTASVVTCPACGRTQREIMAEDACQVVYHCAHCGVVMRPKPGDCCVYCSYGSKPCPPIQRERMLGA